MRLLAVWSGLLYGESMKFNMMMWLMVVVVVFTAAIEFAYG